MLVRSCCSLASDKLLRSNQLCKPHKTVVHKSWTRQMLNILVGKLAPSRQDSMACTSDKMPPGAWKGNIFPTALWNPSRFLPMCNLFPHKRPGWFNSQVYLARKWYRHHTGIAVWHPFIFQRSIQCESFPESNLKCIKNWGGGRFTMHILAASKLL